MKQFRHPLAGIMLIVSIAFAWSPANAVEKFEQAGPISAIGHASFTVENQEYRIAPGAKLKSFDPKRRRLADFRKGDIIIFEGKMINDVYYVDLIVYYAPRPS
ncbi:MAG: hypothetical protein PVI79_11715 [Gammaproteobacteria bacterium]|jgi:hypothetical protein